MNPLPFGFALAASLVVFSGCSSSSSSSDDASRADASADSAVDGGDALVAQSCAAFDAYVQTCKSGDACATAQAAACQSGFMASYSVAFQQAIVSCMTTPFDCTGGDAGTSYGDCLNQKMETFQPTPAQAAVKDAYCKACPGQQCDSFFTLYPLSGEGAPVFSSNDALVQNIGDTCLGGDAGAEVCGNFFLCALGIQNQTAPAACQ